MMPMKLFDYELSGNCYKVRYLLAALGRPFEKVAINFHPGREHKADWFVDQINPLGQIPVLEHDGFLLRDAQAILVYLASAHDDSGRWYPQDPRIRGEIQLWLATAEDITRTASAARLHDGFGFEGIDIETCRRGARAVFRLLDDHLAERHLAGQRWLAFDHVTIADLACFPYAALAPEGGIPLDEYPALRQWLWDFRHQPGFVGMPGILSPGL
jgi:glutathione S-transferase